MKNITKQTLLFCTILVLPLLSFSQESSQRDTLLLTGTVKAQNNQAFFAPKTDSWQVQIKWMLPEGDIAKQGELAVVFDSGSIESTIEQQEISLLAAEEELHRLLKSGEQDVLKAKYALKRTALLLERAK